LLYIGFIQLNAIDETHDGVSPDKNRIRIDTTTNPRADQSVGNARGKFRRCGRNAIDAEETLPDALIRSLTNPIIG
jgi:hypothetical protein